MSGVVCLPMGSRRLREEMATRGTHHRRITCHPGSLSKSVSNGLLAGGAALISLGGAVLTDTLLDGLASRNAIFFGSSIAALALGLSFVGYWLIVRVRGRDRPADGVRTETELNGTTSLIQQRMNLHRIRTIGLGACVVGSVFVLLGALQFLASPERLTTPIFQSVFGLLVTCAGVEYLFRYRRLTRAFDAAHGTEAGTQPRVL